MISTALALLETDEQRNVLSEFYQKYKNRFYAIAYYVGSNWKRLGKLSITKEWLMQML